MTRKKKPPLPYPDEPGQRDRFTVYEDDVQLLGYMDDNGKIHSDYASYTAAQATIEARREREAQRPTIKVRSRPPMKAKRS